MRQHALPPNRSPCPELADLMSISQVTREFGISRATLYRYAKTGLSRQPGRLLALVAVGGRTFVSRIELIEFLIRPLTCHQTSVKCVQARRKPLSGVSTPRLAAFIGQRRQCSDM
jgi:hypothetical protein